MPVTYAQALNIVRKHVGANIQHYASVEPGTGPDDRPTRYAAAGGPCFPYCHTCGEVLAAGATQRGTR